jgi:hypothetical protein
VLYLLIPAAWLAVVYFGLMMCRLAARSDRSQAQALAEWVTKSYFAGSGEIAGGLRHEQSAPQLLRAPRRATG